MTAALRDTAGAACVPPTGRQTPGLSRGYASGRHDYLIRLRRVEGQVRGLQKMIEDDRWCPDIVTQTSAAIRALQEVAAGLLTDHIQHCVLTDADTSMADDRVDEVAATVRQVLRL